MFTNIIKKINKISALLLSIIIVLSGTGCSKEDKEAIGRCTLLVECSTIFDNMDDLDKSLVDYIPDNGVILEKSSVIIQDGDSVLDVLERELKEEGILMEATFTGDSAYIEGIDNIYEFSCGELSGWNYCVNGEYPGISCSNYAVKNGDVIEWHYTCDLGKDLENSDK